MGFGQLDTLWHILTALLVENWFGLYWPISWVSTCFHHIVVNERRCSGSQLELRIGRKASRTIMPVTLFFMSSPLLLFLFFCYTHTETPALQLSHFSWLLCCACVTKPQRGGCPAGFLCDFWGRRWNAKKTTRASNASDEGLPCMSMVISGFCHTMSYLSDWHPSVISYMLCWEIPEQNRTKGGRGLAASPASHVWLPVDSQVLSLVQRINLDSLRSPTGSSGLPELQWVPNGKRPAAAGPKRDDDGGQQSGHSVAGDVFFGRTMDHGVLSAMSGDLMDMGTFNSTAHISWHRNMQESKNCWMALTWTGHLQGLTRLGRLPQWWMFQWTWAFHNWWGRQCHCAHAIHRVLAGRAVLHGSVFREALGLYGSGAHAGTATWPWTSWTSWTMESLKVNDQRWSKNASVISWTLEGWWREGERDPRIHPFTSSYYTCTYMHIHTRTHTHTHIYI